MSDQDQRQHPSGPTPFAATPTPPAAQRHSSTVVWDESTRPTASQDPHGDQYSAAQQAAGQHIVDVHDGLRSELDALRDLIEQVARGETDATQVQTYLNRMTIRQNNWRLGDFCAQYCTQVTHHHMLEDESVFPHLRRRDPALAPIIDRLGQEHEAIHDLVEQIDQALVALVASEAGAISRVREVTDVATDALLSHFAYEERELIEPLARYGFY